MTDTEDRELETLRGALLLGLHVSLPAENPGYAAFERHQLLAIRFHRAARLNAPWEGERQGWRTYFREHFPRGEAQALQLWEDWRVQLVKDESPGKRVLVSHGQPERHWKLDSRQRLFIDLESMWEDFERSVESFMDLLSSDDERRSKTLKEWLRRQWIVEQVVFESPAGMTTTTTASAALSLGAAASASAWAPPPKRTMPTALDNGQRSPRKLLASLERRLAVALRGD